MPGTVFDTYQMLSEFFGMNGESDRQMVEMQTSSASSLLLIVCQLHRKCWQQKL